MKRKNQHGYCKHCGFNFDGDLIIESYLYNKGVNSVSIYTYLKNSAGWSLSIEFRRPLYRLGLLGYYCTKCGKLQ